MLTKGELEAFKILAEEAVDQMGNKCCNDFDLDKFIMDKEELKNFVKEYHDWNGDPEEFDPDYLHVPDFAVFSFLIYKLTGESV